MRLKQLHCLDEMCRLPEIFARLASVNAFRECRFDDAWKNCNALHEKVKEIVEKLYPRSSLSVNPNISDFADNLGLRCRPLTIWDPLQRSLKNFACFDRCTGAVGSDVERSHLWPDSSDEEDVVG